MNIEVKIIQDIPVDQINKFEDRTIYNMALLTREYTKSANGFPYLTGQLRRTETSTPIVGSNKQYGLSSGVDYAKYVYAMQDAHWTNTNTLPHWYASIFEQQTQKIVNNAVNYALKEV